MGALLAAVMRGGELFLICRDSRCTSLFKSCYVVAPIDDSGGPSAKMTTRSEPAHHSPSLPARFFRLRPESEPRMYRLLPVEAPTPVLDASTTTSEGKMFDTFTPKRRRFSFFWN